MPAKMCFSPLALGLAAVVLAVSAPARADDEATRLDAVVVVADRASTATKTDTRLIETPQSISVIGMEQAADRGAQNLQEVLRYSAGAVAEAYGLDTRSDVALVRGFSPVSFLDGMTRQIGSSLVPRPELYTLERLELLRGPSSMLYGAGGSGGVLNQVSKRPQFQRAGEIGLSLGSHQRRQLQFDLTGPLDAAGTLAGRIVGVARDAQLQTDRLPDDRRVLAPSLTWRPSDATTLSLLGLWQHDRSGSSQQFLPVVATLHAPPGRRLPSHRLLGEPQADRLDSRQSSAALLFEHAFSDALRLNSALRYARSRTRFTEIYPDVYSNPADPFIDPAKRVLARSAYISNPDIATLTSDHNLQAEFATGALRHTVLAGIDYLRFRQTATTGFGATTPIDAYAPVYGDFVLPALSRQPRQDQSQLGVYLQDQIRWGRATAVLGARRDRARTQVEGQAQIEDYATSYRAGLIVDAGRGFSPYLSYSESFLPIGSLDFFNQPFKPQRGRQYELGLKWQPRAQTLLTLAAYDIREKNRQTNDPENVLNSVQTGEVSAKGVEFEASHRFDGGFYLTASYSHNRAEVARSNFAAEVGRQLADVPKRLASAWGVKQFDWGDDGRIRLGLGLREVGPTLSIGGNGQLRTPGYTLADALVAFERPQWSFALNLTNLADKQYYAPCRAFGDCFTGNGRNVTGTVTYRF
ncbi:TonB-dependent siderophore receptor [Lysobacter sp. BMK333-48F3]|uniref:TonB-dependent siderophore receptor n=1 Tax=Lysobacter sp. BMK333-48F3 TaxID=2867962 RepID=UPI001C8C35CD|nr:TonB-dependent siderophore receptor [Lysobacter sp. BMK333-48F3]MBX9402389.1 TonB-dependent siderophore receptor [Lysobacter sp. BMK333-48F3]